MAPSSTAPAAHVALFPGSGMGHFRPMLRLAATLSSRGCQVTLITAEPTVSAAEANHLSAFLRSNPEINHRGFHVVPLESTVQIDDPFFKQFEAIRRSLHLLPSLLAAPSSSSSMPPISALVTDMTIAGTLAGMISSETIQIPCYFLCTTSAKFLAFECRLTVLVEESIDFKGDVGEIEIPGGAPPIAKSSIPPLVSVPGHFLRKEFLATGLSCPKFTGILSNTFGELEARTLQALNSGNKFMQGMPPVLPIGPLRMTTTTTTVDHQQVKLMQWLDDQPNKSVVYISFGSRNAQSKDQNAEIAKALEVTGYKFVWILKGGKVDKEDKQDVIDLLGQAFLDRVKDRGLVIKGWVEQEKILSHSATGGFVSHCGWNSTLEAAEWGVPMLAWPLYGDQRMSAEVAVEAGMAVWDRSWGWIGQKLVPAAEIVDKLVELMEVRGEELKARAQVISEEAMKGIAHGGYSDSVLTQFIADCRYPDA